MIQIVDCQFEDVKIGMKVESTFRKIKSEHGSGLVLYGTKFKPLKE